MTSPDMDKIGAFKDSLQAARQSGLEERSLEERIVEIEQSLLRIEAILARIPPKLAAMSVNLRARKHWFARDRADRKFESVVNHNLELFSSGGWPLAAVITFAIMIAMLFFVGVILAMLKFLHF